MSFRKGDRVAFLDEKGGGIVVSVQGRESILIRLDEGVEVMVSAGDIILVPGNRAVTSVSAEEDVSVQAEKLRRENFKTASRGKTVHNAPRVSAASMEVDLHIEELLDDFSGLSNAVIIDIQLSHFEKMMNRAFLERFGSVVFIHGVGNGRLKSEIRKRLKDYPGILFRDANPARFGSGATEVLLGNNL